MPYLSASLFALSVNFDCFFIGLSYGIQKKKFSIFQICIISLITSIGTIAALLLGQQISILFSQKIIEQSGNLLLTGIGCYYILKSHFHRQKENCPPLYHKECLFLSLSLSLNNLGIGVSASISGLSISPAALLSFVFSILFLFLGNMTGNRFTFNLDEKFGDFLCGMILVILSISSYL